MLSLRTAIDRLAMCLFLEMGSLTGTWSLPILLGWLAYPVSTSPMLGLQAWDTRPAGWY